MKTIMDTHPACLDLPRETAEAGGCAATRTLTSTMFDTNSRATLGRRILVVVTVLQTLTGRLCTGHTNTHTQKMHYTIPGQLSLASLRGR